MFRFFRVEQNVHGLDYYFNYGHLKIKHLCENNVLMLQNPSAGDRVPTCIFFPSQSVFQLCSSNILEGDDGNFILLYSDKEQDGSGFWRSMRCSPKIQVSGSHWNTSINRTPTFKWCVVKCAFKKLPEIKTRLQKWLDSMCLELCSYYEFIIQHIRGPHTTKPIWPFRKEKESSCW